MNIGKIKYKRKNCNILYCILFVVLLLDYHFFYMVPYNSLFRLLFDGHRYYVLIGFLGTLLGFFCIYNYKNVLCNRQRDLFVFLVSYLSVWFIEVLYSATMYIQDFSSIVGSGGRFLLIGYTIPILVLFIRGNNVERIFNLLIWFSTIWAIIIILQSISYATTNKLMFDYSSYFYNTSGEEIKLYQGNVRMTLYSIGNIITIYTFDRLYSHKSKMEKKIYLLFVFIIHIVALVFVQQTRMYTVIDAVCISLIVVFRGGIRRSILIKAALIILAICFLLNSSYIYSLIESFSLTGSNHWSTLARLYAVKYYWDCITNNPIFGNGFLSEVNYFTLIHGELGLAHYTDLGIYGLFAETGMMAIVFFVYPFLRICRQIQLLKKKNKLSTFDIALFAYIIGTSITLALTDSRNFLAFTFIIAYFEYRAYFNKNYNVLR